MKKFISIFLLTCLIIPFAGTVSWLNYQKKKVRKQIKHEIIAGIDKDELVYFSFTKEQIKSELRWEHSKEFEYNNQMYDIVEGDTTENSINYWCWWDHQETALNKKLTILLADFLGYNQQNKDTKTRFAIFYQTLYYAPYKQWEALLFEKQNELNTIYMHDYTSLQLTPPSPPPNL